MAEKKKKKNQEKQHYFLVSGQVEYQNANGELVWAPSDCMFASPTREIAVANLLEMQRVLQLRLFKKFKEGGKPEPEVNDVVIGNIIYLGESTEEEFFQDSPK